MIKKSTVLPFLVASLFATGAQAEDVSPVDMFVSADLGYIHYSPNGGKSDSDATYNLRASAAYQDPSHFGGQVDALYNHYDIGQNAASTVDLAGHLFYRNEQFLIGGFVQYRNPSMSTNFHHSGNPSLDWSASTVANFLKQEMVSEQVFWGAEGQAYFGDVTVSGQLAKQEFVNQTDVSFGNVLKDGYVANIKAKYFINDNWKVDAGFNYNKTDLNLNGGSFDQKTYSLGTEYRLAEHPVSLYAQYNHTTLGGSTGYNGDDDQLLVGVKLNFGANSLKARDRSGASLDPVTQQPAGALTLGNLLNSSGPI